MIPIPGPNFAPNANGMKNVGNYYNGASNEQNTCTLRTSTIDTGIILGAASGTSCAKLDPMQGSTKYFIHGSPATRLGDMSMTNNHNASSTQITPSQTKCFINV